MNSPLSRTFLPNAADETDQVGAAESGCSGACFDRRAFLSNGMLAAVAAMLATACSHPSQTVATEAEPETPPDPNAVVVKLSDSADLKSAGGVAVMADKQGKPIAVVRGDNDQFAAFSLVCPHRGGTLELKDNQWVCPRHHATFTKAGEKVSGPAPTNMTALTVKYNSKKGTLSITA